VTIPELVRRLAEHRIMTGEALAIIAAVIASRCNAVTA
jgi:hypothetical protein